MQTLATGGGGQSGLIIVTVKRALLALILFCIIAQLSVLYLFSDRSPSAETPADLVGDAQRGAYLAGISGCITCHTNREDGGAFLAGGAKLVSGMGIFYPPNITSDKNAGIGQWDAKAFARAVRQGVSPNGSQYFPVFPYWAFSDFSDQDIADLWSAFRTSTPSGIKTPSHMPTFPLGNRRVVNSWVRVFGDGSAFKQRTDKSEAWNRGAFIANGPGACMACHDRTTALSSWTLRMLFLNKFDQAQKIPDISPTALRQRGWNRTKLVAALRKGVKSQDVIDSASIIAVLAEATTRLSEEDLNSLAEYLLDSTN